MHYTKEGEAVAKTIIKGTGRAVSDGSFKEKFGTAAFKFLDEKEREPMVGLNAIPGDPGDQKRTGVN